MKKGIDRKMFYFFIGCVTLSVIIIGATFAYFTANIQDTNTVHGATETTSFSMSVKRVTTVDMAYGLIPMRNNQAPHAAKQLCKDDFGNAGCQIYEVTLKGESDQVIFVDGYISTTPKDGVETRFSRVYQEEIEEIDPDTSEVTKKTIFNTSYTKEEIEDDNFNVDAVIKNGIKISGPGNSYNHTEDAGCLFVENEQIGGDASNEINFYVMIWLYDNNENQNFMQGMELAYRGEVAFVTAYGNEIKATFD